MRTFGIAAVAIVAIVAPATARADGELSTRGVYYKEKATRVIQPMLDAHFDVGDEGSLDTHVLVDAITSASAAANVFREQRYEVGAGYLHQLSRLRVGGSGRASYEPDYTSLFAGARAELDLFEKNLVLGAGLSAGHDWVRQTLGNTAEPKGELTTWLSSISVSQIASPNVVVGMTYDVSRLSGYQENPYRSAITSAGLVDENHPDLRWRHAVAASVRAFVPRTETTVIASYRFYGDTWDLFAHTPELRVVQAIGENVEVGLRYRFHVQDQAEFFALSYPAGRTFVTDDIKLSAFTSHLVGAKAIARLALLGFTGNLADARVEVLVERAFQDNRFGNAIIAHAALTLPIRY